MLLDLLRQYSDAWPGIQGQVLTNLIMSFGELYQCAETRQPLVTSDLFFLGVTRHASYRPQ